MAAAENCADSVALTAAHLAPSSDGLSEYRVPPSTTFGELRHWSDQWLKLHHKQGFAFAQVKLDYASCSDTVAIVLQRGEAWLWDFAHPRTPGVVSPAILSQMALLPRGALAQLADLEPSRRLLARRGYFVVGDSVELFRHPQRNLLVPVFELSPIAQNSVSGLVLYSNEANESHWQVEALLELFNIQERGRDFSAAISYIESKRSMELYGRESFLFGSHLDLSSQLRLEADSMANDWDFSINLGWQADFNWRLGVGYLHRSAMESQFLQGGEIVVSYDSRDRVPLPRTGWWWQSQNRWWQSTVPGAKGYFSTGWTGEYFHPIPGRLVLKFAVQAQTLWPRHLNYHARELLRIGGAILPGYWPESILSPQFGVAGLSWWKYFNTSALGLFGEVGAVRFAAPGVHALGDYGVVFEQNQRGIGVYMQAAWAYRASFGEGLLTLGVRSRF